MTHLAVDCSDRLIGAPRGISFTSCTQAECTQVPHLLKHKLHTCYNAAPWLCYKPPATAMKEIIPRAIISIYLR